MAIRFAERPFFSPTADAISSGTTKNRMFLDGEHTGWRSAVIYTFVEQVRRHGRDPFAYFEWVFGKLMHDPGPEEYEALLPANWIKTHPSAQFFLFLDLRSKNSGSNFQVFC